MTYALYNVKESLGYAVEVYRDGTLLERYLAGDSHQDSAVLGTGEMTRDELIRCAVSSGKSMLDEHGEEKAEPEFDPDVSV